jgi:hypothetical protein
MNSWMDLVQNSKLSPYLANVVNRVFIEDHENQKRHKKNFSSDSIFKFKTRSTEMYTTGFTKLDVLKLHIFSLFFLIVCRSSYDKMTWFFWDSVWLPIINYIEFSPKHYLRYLLGKGTKCFVKSPHFKLFIQLK